MLLNYICRVQGLYYLILGIWPILDVDSFMAFTGPKTDVWLVRTVGVLIGVIGFVMLMAQYNKHVDIHIETLAVGSAVGLGIIDVINSLTMRIPIIYLADGFLQAIFATSWIVASMRFRQTGEVHHAQRHK